MEYPKIQTLYNRDPKTFKVIEGDFRCPEFGMIDNWYVTEKIHGRNVGIGVIPNPTGYEPRWFGRTARSEFSKIEMECLWKLFPSKSLTETFMEYHPAEYKLFGELYGPSVQSGGNYRSDLSVRLFDVFVPDEENPLGGWWLEPLDVVDIAHKLGISVAPTMGVMNLDGIVELVKTGTTSVVSETEGGTPDYLMEGIVARTKPLLFTRRGERLMWKLKTKDFEKV